MSSRAQDDSLDQARTLGQVRAEIILRERVKELNCLHAIAEIVTKNKLTLKEFLQAVTDILPSAWLYPEIACVRIRFGDIDCQTPRFRNTPWMIEAELQVGGVCAGSIDVCYLSERPAQDEGPFLHEERLLIDTAAKYISFAINSRLARAGKRRRNP